MTQRERFVYYADTLFEGNQRKMAAYLGCSQALISKIVLGKQDPGGKVLKLLCGHPRVNITWLMTGEGKPLQQPLKGIPVAECPLPGIPDQNKELLTGAQERLTLDSDAVYVLILREDAKILGESSEALLPGDRLLVDADASTWHDNLSLLDRRLCAVRISTDIGATIELRRVYYGLDAAGRKARLVVRRAARTKGKRERAIFLDEEVFHVPAKSEDWQVIGVDDVVGLVRLVYRYA